MAIKHGVDRADRWQVRAGELLAEFLSDLGRAPARILPLQTDDRRFDRCWQAIRLSVCAVAPIAEGLDPAVLVAVEDLVAGLARNPELGAQRRHLFALEIAFQPSTIQEVPAAARPSTERHSRTMPMHGSPVKGALRIDTCALSRICGVIEVDSPRAGARCLPRQSSVA